ncbi:MAG: response regulator [Blastocatellia bacterium]|nr:response regulator [Blastocatellia bacterium]MBL8195319.1 response regulator [Blastocatellia bacterium]
MACKILIADPNLTTYSDLQRLLHEQGHQVETINNGEQVLARVLDFQPNIVLLAVIMPGKLGYQICDEIKSIPASRDTAVVLTFSEDEPFDYLEARRVGATRYLPKSVEPNLLISLLNFIWTGVAPINGLEQEFDNQTLNISIKNKNEVNEKVEEIEEIYDLDDLPDIDMDIEIESLDDMDEDDIQTIEVETDIGIDIEETEETPEPIEAKCEIVLEQKETQPQIDYKFEVPEEKENVEEVLEPVDEIPNLNIDKVNASIELPGLEIESKPIPEISDIKRATTSRLAKIFEPQITGEQFEYFPDDSEDPLQIKHSLNSIACQECGADVLPEDVFCIECGAAVDKTAVHVPETSICSGCGQTVSFGDVFCLNCGMVQ